MKKILVVCVFLICLFSGLCVGASEDVRILDAKVYLNGEAIIFSSPLVSYNGRTMVPMRELFEKLGAKVEWINDEQKIIASSNTKTIEMQINNQWTLCNDIDIYTDVPPVLYNSKTLIPLRFVGEQLNLKVAWDGSTNTITMNGRGITTVGNAEREFIKKDVEISTGEEYEIKIFEKYYGELINGVPNGVGVLERYFYNVNDSYNEDDVPTVLHGCFSDWLENGFVSIEIQDEYYEKNPDMKKFKTDDYVNAGFYENGVRNGLSWFNYDGYKTYTCYYVDGVIDQSYCLIEYDNGNVYAGELGTGVDDSGNDYILEPHGQGEMTFSDGMFYTGNWKYGYCDGNGELYYANGILAYEGQFLDGKMHGYGNMYGENGELLYSGFFPVQTTSVYYDSYDDGVLYGNSIIQSRIKDKFSGFKQDNVYELENGQLWIQTDYKIMYSYKYRPKVVIFKDGSKWKMKVEKIDSMVDVEKIHNIIAEGQINGIINGLRHNNIYEFSNGQKWQQTSIAFVSGALASPKAIIFEYNGRYLMKIDGVDSTIEVKRVY